MQSKTSAPATFAAPSCSRACRAASRALAICRPGTLSVMRTWAPSGTSEAKSSEPSSKRWSGARIL